MSFICSAVPEIDAVSLSEELLSFASVYSELKQGLLDDTAAVSGKNMDGELEDDLNGESVKQMSCKNCLSCALRLLCQYRMISSA